MISMLVAEHVLKVLLTFASPGAYHACAEGAMRSREVIAALEQAGWQRIRQRGSHVQLKHPRRPGLMTVAQLFSSADDGSELATAEKALFG